MVMAALTVHLQIPMAMDCTILTMHPREEMLSANRDSDGDGVPNSKDLDSDNDGISDIREAVGEDIDTHNTGIIEVLF